MNKKLFVPIICFIFLLSCSHKKDVKKDEVIIKKPAKVIIMPFVKVTRDVFLYGRKYGKVKFLDKRFKTVKTVRVDW